MTTLRKIAGLGGERRAAAGAHPPGEIHLARGAKARARLAAVGIEGEKTRVQSADEHTPLARVGLPGGTALSHTLTPRALTCA